MQVPSKYFYLAALAIQLNNPFKVFPKQSKRERTTAINTHTDVAHELRLLRLRPHAQTLPTPARLHEGHPSRHEASQGEGWLPRIGGIRNTKEGDTRKRNCAAVQEGGVASG